MKALFVSSLFLLLAAAAAAQHRFELRAEAGPVWWGQRLVTVDPGPGWRGYVLPARTGGHWLGLTAGVAPASNYFLGLGLGRLAMGEARGLAGFGHAEWSPGARRLRPVLHLRLGYSHFSRPYARGSLLAEPGLGLRYRPGRRVTFSLQTGALLTQQVLLVPLRLGLLF